MTFRNTTEGLTSHHLLIKMTWGPQPSEEQPKCPAVCVCVCVCVYVLLLCTSWMPVH